MKFTARSVTAGLAALFTGAVLAVGLTVPASAHARLAPAGLLKYKGNMCLFDDGRQVGWCVNDPDGTQVNGHFMQNWQRDQQGEPNNDWHGYQIGTVEMANGGWPWPNTLIELSTNQPYDQIYSGKWVVQINFAPNDNDTNYCLYLDINPLTGGGTVGGWSCNGSALNQWWVSDGDGGYINVRGTWDHRNNGDSGSVAMEGEFTNGGTIGGDGYLPFYQYQEYHWYNRYGT